jgi:polysaccharide export outer membrane protein
VLVAGNKEIQEPSRQVSEQGTLDLPLVGEVPVAGLGLQEVEERLAERYSAYLVRPQVVAEFVQTPGSAVSPWGYVTVLGRIRSPGKIPIPATQDLTVSAAIQQAGGLDTSARESSIRVTRQQPGGGARRLDVDLKAYAKGSLDEDVVLQAGDVIFVPESAW